MFVIDNIVMVCDDCLSSPKECVSPKRKQPTVSTNLIQSTIDKQSSTLTLSKSVTPASTPLKNVAVKQNQQIQTVMESLINKVEKQTEKIEGLQSSVKSMKEAIVQQKTAVCESIKVNNESISTNTVTIAGFKTSFDTMKDVLLQQKTITTEPGKIGTPKKTFSSMVKQTFGNRSTAITPKSSKIICTPKSSNPVVSGTSTNVIGKPPSPSQLRPPERRINRPNRAKAVWVSRLHRDTTDEEMAKYIRETIGITSDDKYNVRKLVKKDKELATYNFVSFRITCTVDVFDTLLDEKNWPSYCYIREFEMNQQTSTGPQSNDQFQSNSGARQVPQSMNSKNEQQQLGFQMHIPNELMETDVTDPTETSKD